MRSSLTYPQTPTSWRAQFLAEQPHGRMREYLVWLALRWDEFVQACVRMGAEELLETDTRHAVFAWWMEMGSTYANQEMAQ